MITVHDPIANENGNLELALDGSFLPGKIRDSRPLTSTYLLVLSSIIINALMKIYVLLDFNKNFNFAVPSLDKFPDMKDEIIPGELRPGVGDIALNNGRRAVILKVINNGDRPVQVHCSFALNLVLVAQLNHCTIIAIPLFSI